MRTLMLVLTFVGTGVGVLLSSSTNGQTDYAPGSDKVSVQAESLANKSRPDVLAACDADCRQRLDDDKLRARLEEELRNVPSGLCTAGYYNFTATSRKLAKEAVAECKLNYAMQRIDPDYVSKSLARDRYMESNKTHSRKAEQAVLALSLLYFSKQR